MPKYLKIFLIILLIAAISFGIYWFFKKTPAAQNFIGSILPESFLGGKPEEPAPLAGEKIKALTTDKIFDYWINSKTGDIYYLNDAGQVIKKSIESEELVNSQTLPNLNKISASGDGAYALAKFNYPAATTFSIFNATDNSWQPLPANTIAAAWPAIPSANGQEIIYLDDKALKILNLTGKKTFEIMKMGQKEANLDWISQSTVLLSVPPSIELQSSIWSIDIFRKTILPLFRDQYGLTAKWSKNSDLGLKLYSQKRKALLDLVNSKGTVLDTFNFVTMPEKCLFDKNKLYCAVPQNIGGGLELPDDYYKNAYYSEDAIYLIDLSGAGVSELTANIQATIDAEHLELKNGSLLFKNRLDGKLYNLSLE